MIGQLADLLLPWRGRNTDQPPASITGLINDSFRKQLTKPVFSAMVGATSRSWAAATDMIAKNGLTSNLKESRQDGFVRCEGYAAGWRQHFHQRARTAHDRSAEAASPAAAVADRDLPATIHRGWRDAMFAVVDHAPHQDPKEAQLVVTPLSADPQDQQLAFEAWTQPGKWDGRVIQFHSTVGLRIIPPRAEVGLRSRKLTANKGDRGRQCSHPGHVPDSPAFTATSDSAQCAGRTTGAAVARIPKP